MEGIRASGGCEPPVFDFETIRIEDSGLTPPARLIAAASAILSVVLMVHSATVSSATYDEVAYLRIAADWWRTGRSDEMTRMGSPATFFKLQAGPVFWTLERLGRGDLIADPIGRQTTLLPIVRAGSLWIWLVAFGLTARWSREVYGPGAMAFASVLFAISPNLLAHGSLMTMEMPLVAATTGMAYFFWQFLERGRRRDLVLSAAIGGLAFSCKFTTILMPPILAVLWIVNERPRSIRGLARIGLGMVAYGIILILSDLVLTRFAFLPLSGRSGDHPSVPGALAGLLERRWPQDWVGFATQVMHQRHGGPSYLLGERRMTGWWYYYPVALAVKTPIACLYLIGARCLMALKQPSTRRDWTFPLLIGLFMAASMLGSKRNYGVRYLLPMAPIAVVWISGLVRARDRHWVIGLGLVGQALALASIHPHELSTFNRLAGGPIGGRRILADSNLDWGQGLRSLARLERERFGSLTVFYFGDTDPVHYGIKAKAFVITANDVPPDLPTAFRVETRFVAVSASLQHGPWGPLGYFRGLDRLAPVAYTDDKTIAVYDLDPINKGRDPG